MRLLWSLAVILPLLFGLSLERYICDEPSAEQVLEGDDSSTEEKTQSAVDVSVRSSGEYPAKKHHTTSKQDVTTRLLNTVGSSDDAYSHHIQILGKKTKSSPVFVFVPELHLNDGSSSEEDSHQTSDATSLRSIFHLDKSDKCILGGENNIDVSKKSKHNIQNKVSSVVANKNGGYCKELASHLIDTLKHLVEQDSDSLDDYGKGIQESETEEDEIVMKKKSKFDLPSAPKTLILVVPRNYTSKSHEITEHTEISSSTEVVSREKVVTKSTKNMPGNFEHKVIEKESKDISKVIEKKKFSNISTQSIKALTINDQQPKIITKDQCADKKTLDNVFESRSKPTQKTLILVQPKSESTPCDIGAKNINIHTKSIPKPITKSGYCLNNDLNINTNLKKIEQSEDSLSSESSSVVIGTCAKETIQPVIIQKKASTCAKETIQPVIIQKKASTCETKITLPEPIQMKKKITLDECDDKIKNAEASNNGFAFKKQTILESTRKSVASREETIKTNNETKIITKDGFSLSSSRKEVAKEKSLNKTEQTLKISKTYGLQIEHDRDNNPSTPIGDISIKTGFVPSDNDAYCTEKTIIPIALNQKKIIVAKSKAKSAEDETENCDSNTDNTDDIQVILPSETQITLKSSHETVSSQTTANKTNIKATILNKNNEKTTVEKSKEFISSKETRSSQESVKITSYKPTIVDISIEKSMSLGTNVPFTRKSLAGNINGESCTEEKVKPVIVETKKLTKNTQTKSLSNLHPHVKKTIPECKAETKSVKVKSTSEDQTTVTPTCGATLVSATIKKIKSKPEIKSVIVKAIQTTSPEETCKTQTGPKLTTITEKNIQGSNDKDGLPFNTKSTTKLTSSVLKQLPNNLSLVSESLCANLPVAKVEEEPSEEEQKVQPCEESTVKTVVEEKKDKSCDEERKVVPFVDEKIVEPCVQEKKVEPYEEIKKAVPCEDEVVKVVVEENGADCEEQTTKTPITKSRVIIISEKKSAKSESNACDQKPSNNLNELEKKSTIPLTLTKVKSDSNNSLRDFVKGESGDNIEINVSTKNKVKKTNKVTKTSSVEKTNIVVPQQKKLAKETIEKKVKTIETSIEKSAEKSVKSSLTYKSTNNEIPTTSLPCGSQEVVKQEKSSKFQTLSEISKISLADFFAEAKNKLTNIFDRIFEDVSKLCT